MDRSERISSTQPPSNNISHQLCNNMEQTPNIILWTSQPEIYIDPPTQAIAVDTDHNITLLCASDNIDFYFTD